MSLSPPCIDNFAFLSVSRKTREHNMKIKPKTANQNFSVVVLKNLFIMIISLDVLETPGNGHFIRQGKPCTDEIPRQEYAGTNKIVFFFV